MNKDQVKGTAKDIAGKVQYTTGKLTRRKTQQAKGLAKQVAGKAQKGDGDARDTADKAERERYR